MTEQLKIVEALSEGLRHEQLDRMVALHNGYRAMHGIGALAVHETLMQTAQVKVEDLVKMGLLQHNDSKAGGLVRPSLNTASTSPRWPRTPIATLKP